MEPDIPSRAGLRDIASLSRFLGSNPGLVQGKGGNTSLKSGGMLYVKSSGTRLRDVSARDFIPLELEGVRNLLTESSVALSGKRARERLLALSKAQNGHPSIETFLHACMPGEYVAHLHPVYANALGCMEGGETIAREIFGPDGPNGPELIWVGYRMPGYEVGIALNEALTARIHSAPPTLVLMANHGLIVASNTPEGVHSSLDNALARIEAGLVSLPEIAAPDAPQGGLADLFGRVLSQSARFARCPYAGMLAKEPDLFVGPLFPDQIVYCGHAHLELSGRESEAQVREKVSAFAAAHGYEPRYALVHGKGLIISGRDEDGIVLKEEVLGAYAKVSMLLKRLGARPRLIPEYQCRALLFGEG